MSCRELESAFSDLARSQMMDASLRERALSHAESCACCAQRFADERALTDGLRLVATASEGDEAPARVEASLVAAFRESHGALPARAFGSARVASRRWLYIAAGVAAAAVIVMLLSLTVSRTQDSPQKAEQHSSAPPVGPQELHQPLVLPASQPGPEHKLASGHNRGPGRRGTGTRGTGRANETGASREDAEIATDFFPLMNRESLTQLDSGQIVRVELPRSALMSFGLPMNMERVNERIKADVVVGNDGLARAIRFVR